MKLQCGMNIKNITTRVEVLDLYFDRHDQILVCTEFLGQTSVFWANFVLFWLSRTSYSVFRLSLPKFVVSTFSIKFWYFFYFFEPTKLSDFVRPGSAIFRYFRSKIDMFWQARLSRMTFLKSSSVRLRIDVLWHTRPKMVIIRLSRLSRQTKKSSLSCRLRLLQETVQNAFWSLSENTSGLDFNFKFFCFWFNILSFSISIISSDS